MNFRDLLASSLRLTCAASLLLGGCVFTSTEDGSSNDGTDDNATSGGPGGDDTPDDGVGTGDDGGDSGSGGDDGVDPTPPCGDNILEDGGFEAGAPSMVWSEMSAVFGTPICNSMCSEDPGALPLEGDWWLWFGGVEEPDLASVSQTFALTADSAELQFYFDINASGANGSDIYTVRIDDEVVFMATDAEMDSYNGYTEIILDISDFADGADHVLSINGDLTGDGLTNFFTDNVSISACSGAVDESGDADTGMTDGMDTVADTAGDTGSSSDATAGTTDAGTGSTGGGSSSGTAG